MLPAIADEPAEVGECWVRRYRCTRCSAVLTVLPRGVLPRFLYSGLAIVVAFVLTAARPVGRGLSDAEVYDRQGMYRCRRWTKPWPYRWRSVDRWASKIGAWWPGLAADSIEDLLIGLLRRAGTEAFAPLLGAAVASHVRWGAAM